MTGALPSASSAAAVNLSKWGKLFKLILSLSFFMHKMWTVVFVFL